MVGNRTEIAPACQSCKDEPAEIFQDFSALYLRNTPVKLVWFQTLQASGLYPLMIINLPQSGIIQPIVYLV
jgi:hypothetical protein